jgi:folate-binding protein YgfZ
MTTARIARLADRGAVRVAGADAAKFLQGIVTNDMELLASRPAIHAALLAPQGKVLFDFFVVRTPAGFVLETGRDAAGDLAKRLAMYRLRAKVEMAVAGAETSVLALWGQGRAPPQRDDLLVYADPRLPELGLRLLDDRSALSEIAAACGCEEATAQDYHAHRIALGVPEGGKDYAFGDAFPHEADLDQLAGISFSKGCFVGQEVVARMQHRAAVRKRVIPVESDAPLTPGANVEAGAALIGAIGSVADRQALALIRLDRAAEAVDKGQTLTAGGVPIRLRKPAWATFDLAAAAAAGTP